MKALNLQEMRLVLQTVMLHTAHLKNTEVRYHYNLIFKSI
jgi:hypothetical protein